MSLEPLLPTTKADEIDHKYIVIRFSDESLRDLELDITNVPFTNISTKWLRNMCRSRRPEKTERKRLKFIRNGVILNATSGIANDLARFFRNNSTENGDKFYVHCMVGVDTLTDRELANEDELDERTQSANSTTSQAIGFDRLRAVGFSEEEIDMFREQFRRTYGDLQNLDTDSSSTEVNGNGNNGTGNVDIRELEEQWMDTGVNRSPNGNGVNDPNADNLFNSVSTANLKHSTDILLGLTVGYTLGLFGLLLMKVDKIFNRRQKMAIVSGVFINMMFTLAV
ncbi:hypothetical protein TPHA_0F03270 [Tetrapisispora phaffii CBS 4417]|uniref:DSC E3 ubiquitin ligase complex subunit 3 C-terminal domain-containing protein n=1 Tax=Tetrapisispora phaffii (strain ATCC 24235 / CBS 4417 / NBRC 1672 / NRRL Y-8282 / UCD 70-5) TaxID=1071381 RepID=G8BUM2_TETPH|nr:hypothetical protein TPHA_0F03270 [Tetrapisispora phaffii CBS 4417]CCE63808.1 hypothetical protein TPHA_0F03270 [Tetrapisispora phaffii CBS 4417]